MRNAGLEETQAGIKIAGRNINNLRYVDDTTVMAESEEELKSLLMKVKEESEKVGNLISGSSAFSKSILNIRKFTAHVLLKPGLENFEHYFTSM